VIEYGCLQGGRESRMFKSTVESRHFVERGLKQVNRERKRL